MLRENKNPLKIVKEKNLTQITDSAEIENIIDSILEKNSDEVKQYLDGKEKVFGFFVGKVMRETKGKANPKLVNEVLRDKLNSLKEA
jgi:aspartyl-tRNA(Asn)/glutamyl-tRNA(Gln) amidotransferase subunit B